MKIYYVANARMPTEKAHGIQIAKMCEAFIQHGTDLTLVVPGRDTVDLDIQTAYGLKAPVPVEKISVPNIYEWGKLGFGIGTLCFMIGCALFFWRKKVQKEQFLIYTVDMDNVSNALLPLFAPTVTEMHTPKPANAAQTFFFPRATGVIATNELIKNALRDTFYLDERRLLVEPNGVDLAVFAPQQKSAARVALGLPQDAQIAVYVGRFYAWKGLEILPDAAQMPAGKGIAWYVVGGDEASFKKISHTKELPQNVHVVASQPLAGVAQWIAAADAVLVLGTKANEDSFKFTSPMKVFEYMAADRPVVASRTPALASVLSDKQVFFYDPDDAFSLAVVVAEAITNIPQIDARVSAAHELVRLYTWDERAKRILAFITRAVTLAS